MSESLSIDEGWVDPLDNDVTHVKGDAISGATAAGEWLVNVAEQVVVPMTTTDVVLALRAHRLSERSLVWRAGMQEWTALADVPPLRLAAGKLAAPEPAPAPERLPLAQPARALHPPPKEPARAARDERVRRNTLPFGFPVLRDPATIREPVGLHFASAPVAVAPRPRPPGNDDAEALAIYERAAPSLTFSDSVRAEWQGTTGLLHQPASSAAPPVASHATLPGIAVQKIEQELEQRPKFTREPPVESKPKLTLEPQSDPKPRLTLEPQSDPMQSRRAELERNGLSSQAPSSLAPTTSEPGNQLLRARGAGLWGDLSVVLASDLRAVKASSKRITLIASLGSAALASLLTLWLARSPAARAPKVAPASQPVAAAAPPRTEVVVEPSVVPAPTALPTPDPIATPTPSAAPTPNAHLAPTLHAGAVAVHAAQRVVSSSPPRAVVARPKPPPPSASEPETPGVVANPGPYSATPEPSQPKTPTAAFKESGAVPAPSPGSNAPKPPSGLEDNAQPVHPPATGTPGF